jgi:antitoxin CcdA
MRIKYAHPLIKVNAMSSTASPSVRRASRTKRAANLSISSDLLDDAKALGINVSQVCDAYLRQVVQHEQALRWRSEYAAFIAAYNHDLDANGLPLDEWRSF